MCGGRHREEAPASARWASGEAPWRRQKVLEVVAGGLDGMSPKDEGEGAGRDEAGGRDRMCMGMEMLKGWRVWRGVLCD